MSYSQTPTSTFNWIHSFPHQPCQDALASRQHLDLLGFSPRCVSPDSFLDSESSMLPLWPHIHSCTWNHVSGVLSPFSFSHSPFFFCFSLLPPSLPPFLSSHYPKIHLKKFALEEISIMVYIKIQFLILQCWIVKVLNISRWRCFSFTISWFLCIGFFELLVGLIWTLWFTCLLLIISFVNQFIFNG